MTVLQILLILKFDLNFRSRKNLLSGNCDGGHSGNSKGEDVELHFDRLKFVGLVGFGLEVFGF